ncbi:Rap1a/Tai family immunity protein [Desulforhabdus sp. TSK]|uniref:Rap1a/Tai family immunity protein n=1 Tax=Desulforhabdus sp. TSK TaxID=2925014 RepID=UPI001FC88C97|nr:Rap1a/Tai family immunity protein [Desulforhabdus sp. TSK]GKT10575.1 hypothetical protein DSTSK_38800 [Desulforhabdus sp. TSK]
MNRKLASLLLAVVLLMPSLAGAVTDEDFKVATTQNLINLCTASAGDPRQKEAIHFCHGYLVGAFHYHTAENAGPEGKQLLCPPDPEPTRNQTIAMFLEWAKANPQYMGEPAVDSEFRFLMEKWPCKP